MEPYGTEFEITLRDAGVGLVIIGAFWSGALWKMDPTTAPVGFMIVLLGAFLVAIGGGSGGDEHDG